MYYDGVNLQKSWTWGHCSQLTSWYGGLLYNHERQSVNHEFQCPLSNLPFNLRSRGFLNGGRALGDAPILSWLDLKEAERLSVVHVDYDRLISLGITSQSI